MIEVREGSLDPRVAQPRFSVAIRTINAGISLMIGGRPGPRRVLPSILLGDEGPVPRQQRVRRHDGGEFVQQPSSLCPDFRGEPPPLVVGFVGEVQAPGSDLFTQDAILFLKIIDDVALLLVNQPASATRTNCSGCAKCPSMLAPPLATTREATHRFQHVAI